MEKNVRRDRTCDAYERTHLHSPYSETFRQVGIPPRIKALFTPARLARLNLPDQLDHAVLQPVMLQLPLHLAASHGVAVSHGTISISPCSPHRTAARHLASFAHIAEASLDYVLDDLNYVQNTKPNM